jgi:ABC-2 type transport system permease protein
VRRPVPSLFAASATIAALELRRRLRDRSALIRGIVAPVVLAVLIGVALGSTSDFSTTIAVVDADGSPVSRGIADGLLGGVPADAPVRLMRATDEATARRDLTDDRVDAVVVLPTGFGASVARADPGATPLPLGVVADVRKRISGEIARSLAGGLGARVDAVRLATATALAASAGGNGPADPAGGTPDVAALAAAAQRLPATLVVAEQPAGDPYRPVAYFGASMAVLFLFFTVGSAASSLIGEQREGTLARVRAAPVDDRAILVGKALSTLVLAFVTLSVMWLVTTYGFGAHWGDPAAVVFVLAAAVAAVAGIGSLIAGVARTEQQAMAWTAAISFVLALLGGGLQQPGSLPGFLSRLSLATPNGWALSALTRVGAADAGLIDVLPAVAVLSGMAAVTLTLGLRLLSRRVRA